MAHHPQGVYKRKNYFWRDGHFRNFVLRSWEPLAPLCLSGCPWLLGGTAAKSSDLANGLQVAGKINSWNLVQSSRLDEILIFVFWDLLRPRNWQMSYCLTWHNREIEGRWGFVRASEGREIREAGNEHFCQQKSSMRKHTHLDAFFSPTSHHLGLSLSFTHTYTHRREKEERDRDIDWDTYRLIYPQTHTQAGWL